MSDYLFLILYFCTHLNLFYASTNKTKVLINIHIFFLTSHCFATQSLLTFVAKFYVLVLYREKCNGFLTNCSSNFIYKYLIVWCIYISFNKRYISISEYLINTDFGIHISHRCNYVECILVRYMFRKNKDKVLYELLNEWQNLSNILASHYLDAMWL